MARIIFGICGISYGHLNRQKNIVQKMLHEGHHLQIFTFGAWPDYCSHHFPEITVHEVSVPWIVCDKNGIDFLESAKNHTNQDGDAFRKNFSAMHQTIIEFGAKPDLIISDYEPISAQFAYATGTALMTSDQQSKFTFLPYEEIDWFSNLEEKWRLDLFFPKAEKRVVCSFFKLWTKPPRFLRVVPPIIKHEIQKIRHFRKKTKPHLILLYQSSMMTFAQPPDEICDIVSKIPNQEFVVYSPYYQEFQNSIEKRKLTNIHAYPIGNATFEEHLMHTKWAISTAGHSFISELMYLGIPVYTTPLPIFEQRKTAKVIADNEFWVSAPWIQEELLKYFIRELVTFSENIQNDTSILLRGNGTKSILRIIHQLLNNPHASKN